MASPRQQKQIYRQAALDRLSAPEQLDQKLAILPPIGWLAVVALLLFLLATLVWGFRGTVVDTVAGEGILTYRGGIVAVSARAEGRLTDVGVRSGQRVERGQVIARVARDDLIEQLEQCGRDLEVLDALTVDTLPLDHRKLSPDLSSEFAELSQRIALARTQLADSETQLDALAQELAWTKEIRRSDLLRQRDSLREQFTREGAVVASVSGVVLDCGLQKGDYIREGDEVAFVANGDEGGDVVLFVPVARGKRVQAGMEAAVYPATSGQEHGFIRGEVTQVSAYAVSAGRMQQLLHNRQLAAYFSGSEPVLEVRIKLSPDPATKSGYSWSTADGYPSEIDPGTVCAAEIQISSRRPVDLILPSLRRLVAGGDQ